MLKRHFSYTSLFWKEKENVQDQMEFQYFAWAKNSTLAWIQNIQFLLLNRSKQKAFYTKMH